MSKPWCKEQLAHGCYATTCGQRVSNPDLAIVSRASRQSHRLFSTAGGRLTPDQALRLHHLSTLQQCQRNSPDSVPDLGAIQIIYLLTYLLTYSRAPGATLSSLRPGSVGDIWLNLQISYDPRCPWDFLERTVVLTSHCLSPSMTENERTAAAVSLLLPFFFSSQGRSHQSGWSGFSWTTFRKISKIGATRCQILRLKCTKFAFRWGSAPDPAGELTALP